MKVIYKAFIFHLGNLNRLKQMNVKQLWNNLKTESNVMKYFPDICYKRVPPKNYFWKIYYYLKKDSFKKQIETQIKTLTEHNKIKSDNITMSNEAEDIYKKFEFNDNLRLLGNIIS